jgi:hypothetical protein
MAFRILAFVACVFLGAACYLTPNSGPSAGGTGSVTFHKDIEPIFQQHCDGCHLGGGIAPFPLLTYADAQPYAQDIAKQTGARIMPPWGARNTDECTTRAGFKNDPSLTDDQIKAISDWATAGAPEGDPADAPPPFEPPPSGLDGAQVDLAPASGFTLPPSDSQDEYMCYVLDPKITTTTWVNGTNIVPGNPLIVHHAIIFADPNRESPALVTNPQNQSYPCFGGPGVSSTSLVAAWAPGGLPRAFPSNVGMPLAPDTLLVMQIHYHPHTLDPHNQDPDVTHLELRYTSSAPQYYAVNKIIGNFSTPAQGLEPGPDFDIPADDPSYTQSMVYTVPSGLTGGRPAWIYSVGGHMHLVGADIKITLDRANPTDTDPGSECLLQIPRWDFDWQRQYDYDLDVTKLPRVSSGDTLRVRCTYDNTLDNAQLVAELQAQGRSQTSEVKLGETSLDEMCLALITAVVPAQ